jgi:site-specific DNA-methyltransferase (adenine-specific)
MLPAIPAVLDGTVPWHIEHGDCLTVLRSLPDACVDAVVTDPPYGISYRSKRLGTVANDSRPFVWWLHDAHRVTREGGSLVCFCRWDVQESFRLAIDWAGWRVRSQVVWDKGVHGAGDCAAQFGPQHEVMWFATKGRFRFPGRRPVSVLRAARVPHGRCVHPTEKPVVLMTALVEAVTAPAALVLDPFAGSGSTGAAAVELGRRFLGVEMEGRHVDAGRARIGG